MAKKYEELVFTDDFMFCKIMSTHLDLTKKILEMILNIKIRNLVLAEEQKTIDLTSEGRGVRLDVYVEDELNTIFDLEMQTTRMKTPGKRTRYYQGMIDLNTINKGSLFSALRKCYIVFICMEDPFDKNYPIYTFENRCIEDTELSLGDESKKVFVNPDGISVNMDNGMKVFFRYLKTGKAEDAFTKDLDEAVAEARKHEKWRSEYMTLMLRDQEKREEGRIEGRNEEKKAIMSILEYNALHPTESAESVAFNTGTDIETVNSILKFLRK